MLLELRFQACERLLGVSVDICAEAGNGGRETGALLLDRLGKGD